MIQGIVISLIAYWLIVSLAALIYVRKIFQHYRNYPRIEYPEHIQSSVRTDFGKWDEKAIIRGCFTTFPIHATCMFLYLFFYAIIATAQKYLKYPDWVINIYRYNVGRFAFKICFNLIEDYDFTQKIQTPIVSSNHVNWVDFIYMGSCFQLVSFVAKIQISHLPIISSIAKYINALYVDRSNTDNRNMVKEDILQRVREFQRNPTTTFPLVIYPEGSCTHGRAIMKFTNGAFQALCPITFFTLKYECKEFYMGLEEVSNGAHAIITFCLKPTLRVAKQVMTPLENETVEEYRDRSRTKLSQMTGFQLIECTFKEQMEYLYKIEALVKERDQKLRGA